jgi:hypothetical protein
MASTSCRERCVATLLVVVCLARSTAADVRPTDVFKPVQPNTNAMVVANSCNSLGRKLKCYECGMNGASPCSVGTGSGPFSRRGDIVECDARAICSSTYDLKKGTIVSRGCSFCTGRLGCEVIYPGYLTCHCSSGDLCNGFSFNNYNSAPGSLRAAAGTNNRYITAAGTLGFFIFTQNAICSAL